MFRAVAECQSLGLPNVFLYVFDLIELNGDDLRRDPIEVRKATLASVLTKEARGGSQAQRP